jgi:hypothetical protein
MGKRFAFVIGVAAAGVMALGAQTASAGVHKYDTWLTLRLHQSEKFRYWVQSEGGKVCERGRRVVLFEVRPGADRRLGTARSKYSPRRRRGVALIRARKESLVVYAKVRREVHDEFVCRADRSKVHDDR